MVGPFSCFFVRAGWPSAFFWSGIIFASTMSVPQPTIKLAGHCSVIYGNTLYAYSSHGFASISLSENSTWSTLDSDSAEKVSGAACVLAPMEDKDEQALYVIGGSGASSGYKGLQRYSFSDEKWETLTPNSDDMADRTSHGAGYLKSSSSIVVYGGDRDQTGSLSSSTFLISTKSPYNIRSLPSQGAPPASGATLLPWNSTSVALIGGSTSTSIYAFSDSRWGTSGAVLPDPIPSTAGCALVSGTDGSTVLEEFTLGASPNTVTSYAVVTAEGDPANPAKEVGTASSKRSADSYPTYNDTYAPTIKRSGYSIAQGKSGLVVFSSDDQDHSLSIFNSTSNGWVNATELFYGTGTQSVSKASGTASSSSTPTSTDSTASNTATSSSAPAAAGRGHAPVGTIVGATIGSVAGLIIILLAILFFLRRSKQKKQQTAQAAGGGNSKDRLSFQDQGIEPLTEGAYPMAKSPVPVAGASRDSLAIISGTATGEKSLRPPSSNVGYGLSKPAKSSPLSTIPSSGASPSSMYSEQPSPAVGAASENRPGDRTTDEGWGKYFEDNNATNLSRMQSDRSTASSVYTKSDYRNSDRNSTWPMTNLTPLNFGFLDQPKPLGRVVSGSPTTETPPQGHSLVIPEGQSARISSADSLSLASEDDPHDTKWTGAGKSSWFGRPDSSNYSLSFYNSSTRDLPASSSQPNQSDLPPRHSNGRRSSVVIPDHIDEFPAPGRGHPSNDMSWLNIHAER